GETETLPTPVRFCIERDGSTRARTRLQLRAPRRNARTPAPAGPGARRAGTSAARRGRRRPAAHLEHEPSRRGRARFGRRTVRTRTRGTRVVRSRAQSPLELLAEARRVD